MNRRKFIAAISALPVVALLPDVKRFDYIDWYRDSIDLGTGDYTIEYWQRGGSIDSFRVSHVARYTSQFKPPMEHIAIVQKNGTKTKYVDGEVV
jgi:hypothetical protein